VIILFQISLLKYINFFKTYENTNYKFNEDILKKTQILYTLMRLI